MGSTNVNRTESVAMRALCQLEESDFLPGYYQALEFIRFRTVGKPIQKEGLSGQVFEERNVEFVYPKKGEIECKVVVVMRSWPHAANPESRNPGGPVYAKVWSKYKGSSGVTKLCIKLRKSSTKSCWVSLADNQELQDEITMMHCKPLED